MSFKTALIKMAIKWTPKSLVVWVANIVLKGIAEMSDFNFDLEARKAYVQTTLCGEAEAIEVWLEDFGVVGDEKEGYKFILQKARSNRLWLTNIFSRIIGKAWPIPVIPQLAAHMGLVAELLKAETPALEGESTELVGERPEPEAETPLLERID